ncbi:MAG TPA: tetratricopeptide repeat protein [Pyrinomonadaceae bacterium]|jgi:tetratricopeptide (TPR) repeat protein
MNTKRRKSEFEFDAFISYSGTPEVARLVYSYLSRVGGSLWRLSRWWNLKVFFDKGQIRVGDDLSASISHAVRHARYFVLLASTTAAQSKWVAKELEFWLRIRPASDVLIVVLDGAIAWDEEAMDFDWEMTDCIPQILKGRYREECWEDLRVFSSAAGTRPDKERLREVVASLGAKILDVPREQLRCEEERIYKRRRAAALVLVACLIVSAAFIVYFWLTAVTPADKFFDKGHEKIVARKTWSHVLSAMNYFERALQTDPRHVPSLLGLADAHILLIGYGGSKSPAEDLIAAERALARAKEWGAEDTSEYHRVMGRLRLYKYKDVRGAHASLMRAVALDPDNVDAIYALASTYTHVGQQKEAIQLCENALEIVRAQGYAETDAKYVHAQIQLAWTYFYAGHIEAAIMLSSQILATDPSSTPPNRFLANARIVNGDYQAAVINYKAAIGHNMAQDPDLSKNYREPNLYPNYVCALVRNGDLAVDEARWWLDDLRKNADYVSPYRLAQGYACLGDVREALAQLRRAREESDLFVVWSAVDPLLSSLRGYPEFQEHLRAVGLKDVTLSAPVTAQRQERGDPWGASALALIGLTGSAALAVHLAKGKKADEVCAEGRARLAGRRNGSDVRKALDKFEHALELSGAHASALLGKAEALSLLVGYGTSTNPARDMEAARGALARAEQCGCVGTAEYHYVKGRILLYKDRDVSGARAALLRAVKLDPRHFGARHTLASTYTFLGQHDAAIRVCRKALDLARKLAGGTRDDNVVLSQLLLCWTYYYAESYDLAERHCREILAADPAHAQVKKFLCHIHLQKGDYERALKGYVQAGAKSNADSALFAAYSCALALSGQVLEAERNIRTLLANTKHVQSYRLAQCYACAGDTERALARLERARDEGDIFVLWARVDPLLRSLQGNPAFAEYLIKVGLREADA